jgi:7-cyano-7-deazaguanine synthase
MTPLPPKDSLAVLISGGLDSAILLGEAVKQHALVFPIYIRCGLFY